MLPEDQAKPDDQEADQNSDTIEGSEAEENTGESTDSDKPATANDEQIEPDQQPSGQTNTSPNRPVHE